MTVDNERAGEIVLSRLINTIHKNAAFLSEVDGKIGDGDHGVNMNKGFMLCADKLHGKTYSLSEGLGILGSTLLEDIGGSMGPIYGMFFEEMADACGGLAEISARDFERMLRSALHGIQDIGNAKPGDKTLLDTLIPGVQAYSEALDEGKNFYVALDAMRDAARDGWQKTENMVAKVGRASRLGERSRGILDAGATSCYLLLEAMADAIQNMLQTFLREEVEQKGT